MSALKMANAPCSWGVLEFELEGQVAGYAQVLNQMAQAGYQGTELGEWGFMPTDPNRLRQELERRSLMLVAAFVPVALARPEAHAHGAQLALKTARLLAAAGDNALIVLADDNGRDPLRTQYAGRIQPGQGLSDAPWRRFSAGAMEIARRVLEATGVRTVFHPHCAGFVETPDEIETFLELTDPELIGLCFDTGHYTYGGGDAATGLKQYAKRIGHIHFKDCDPRIAATAREQGWDYFAAVRHGLFCELGQGSVAFPLIVAELQDQGYEGWIVVEQDILPSMGTPLESAERNRAYLRKLGL